MFYLLLQRLWKQLAFYIALGIGIACAIAYFWVDELPLHESIIKTGGVSFTPYTKWMGIGGISDYSTLFMFLLPILASLPLADLYAKDKRTGFIRFLLVRGKHKQYLLSLLILNFFTGMFVAILPLFINVYLSFMKLPNIKPDRIINNEMPLTRANTFFPELYYTHPFIHMLFYILLIGIYSGMFATLSLGIGMLIKKSFIILLTPFALQYALNMIFSTINHCEMMASSFLQEQAMDGISVDSMIIQLFGGLIVGIVLYTMGVKKNVIL